MYSRKIKNILIIGVILLGFHFAFAAPIDVYPFASLKQQQQFNRLTSQLRCLVCQNESLADSNAPLAKDLRYQVYKMIKHHQSDKEIIGYLTDRYGDFVIFKPPVTVLTFILWFGPLIMLIVALGRLYWLIMQRRKKQLGKSSSKNRSRIAKLLNVN